jgi:hypothetical protein
LFTVCVSAPSPRTTAPCVVLATRFVDPPIPVIEPACLSVRLDSKALSKRANASRCIWPRRRISEKQRGCRFMVTSAVAAACRSAGAVAFRTTSTAA